MAIAYNAISLCRSDRCQHGLVGTNGGLTILGINVEDFTALEDQRLGPRHVGDLEAFSECLHCGLGGSAVVHWCREAKQLAHPVVSGDLADGDGILVDRDIGREVIEGKIILVCFFDFEGFVGLDGQSEGYGGVR
jgi:hypothetical protein